MGLEIDYLAVGEGERSGDAIALRYGNLQGPREQQTVMVIDGGTAESGEQLVQHIRGWYNTDRVDYAWATHHHADHVRGLQPVVEQLKVGQLLMHKPWDHAANIRSWFRDGRITNGSLRDRLRESLQAAHDLEVLARRRGVPITEPFTGTGTNDGSILVLGPSLEYYRSLLPLYDCTPEPLEAMSALLRKAWDAAKEAVSYVAESVNVETLHDPDGESGTTPENNSSLVLLLQIEGRKLLFTADAGVPALTLAADYAQTRGISLSDLSFLDVPHHGSKRNLGPTILNRIRAHTAYISAARNGEPKHPSKKVVNALIRRGAQVHATQGQGLCHYYGVTNRAGWHPIQPLPFYAIVEE